VISAAGKLLLIMFHAIKVGTDSEVGDLLSFTLRTVTDGIGFDSLASRENSAMDGGNGDEVITRSYMKRGGKRRKLSTSEEYLPMEGIISSDDLHSSISSALAQLSPERQNQMSEKAERSFKLFTALKASRLFRQTCEGSPEAEGVADLEIKRLLKISAASGTRNRVNISKNRSQMEP
jgi:hypothetical protein